MARNDGVDRTFARNRDLRLDKKATPQSAYAHNERQKESYSNPDIVPERTPMNAHFKSPVGTYEETFDALEQAGVISTWGMKPNSTKLCELIFDVNSAYFYNHGGYEFAKQFYADAYQAAIQIVGGEQYIVSAVMHADERNRGMSEALGEDVYHYHMHVVYVPVVDKEVLWTKRCKDKSLVGKVKEVKHQVSRTKKWDSKQAVDENGELMFDTKGKKILRPSYSVLQDDFYNFMHNAGYGGSSLGREQRRGLHAVEGVHCLLLRGGGEHKRTLRGVQAVVRGQRAEPADVQQLQPVSERESDAVWHPIQQQCLHQGQVPRPGLYRHRAHGEGGTAPGAQRQALKKVRSNFILSVHAYNRTQTQPRHFPRVFTWKTDSILRAVHMYACTDDFHFIPTFFTTGRL